MYNTPHLQSFGFAPVCIKAPQDQRCSQAKFHFETKESKNSWSAFGLFRGVNGVVPAKTVASNLQELASTKCLLLLELKQTHTFLHRPFFELKYLQTIRSLPFCKAAADLSVLH